MKKIGFVLALALLAMSSEAQIKAVGLKTGLNYSSAVINETFTSSGTNWKYVTEEAEVAPLFGAFVRIKMFHLFVQPELMFSDHKTTMRVSSINLDSLQTFRQNRIDVPLLIGYSRKDRLRGFIGPVYTRVLENKITSDAFLHDEVRDLLENGSWALQMGMGFDMGPLALDLRYETSLGRIANKVNLGGHDFNFDHRNSIFQVSLGWDFVR